MYVLLQPAVHRGSIPLASWWPFRTVRWPTELRAKWKPFDRSSRPYKSTTTHAWNETILRLLLLHKPPPEETRTTVRDRREIWVSVKIIAKDDRVSLFASIDESIRTLGESVFRTRRVWQIRVRRADPEIRVRSFRLPIGPDRPRVFFSGLEIHGFLGEKRGGINTLAVPISRRKLSRTR